jgi:hypothetical protein
MKSSKNTMYRWMLTALLVALTVSCAPLRSSEVVQPQPTLTLAPENPPTSTATLSAELPGYTSTSLEIIRNGKNYSVPLGYRPGEAFWRVTPHADLNIDSTVRQTSSANLEWYGDFDNDGETEYLVSAYSVGNTLYVSILAIDYNNSKDEYKIFDEVGFRVTSIDKWDDIEKDGVPEIIASDETFHYESGGSGADSAFSPIKILRYDGHEFISTTKEYPDLVEQDAKYWLEAIDNNAWGQGQFLSIYASYLADMYLLGKKEEGIRVFSELCESRLMPYIKQQNPETTWNCDDLLDRIQEALEKTGYG